MAEVFHDLYHKVRKTEIGYYLYDLDAWWVVATNTRNGRRYYGYEYLQRNPRPLLVEVFDDKMLCYEGRKYARRAADNLMEHFGVDAFILNLGDVTREARFLSRWTDDVAYRYKTGQEHLAKRR